MSYIPDRTCMGCNKKREKNELIRIAKKNEFIFIDKTGKMEGRGAYICNNVECLEKLINSKRLNRIFKMNIDNKFYEELRGVLIDK